MLIILTKKKILKMWLAGGESNPYVKNIYGLNANMYIYLLYCPIAAAATESPSCQCVKNTLSVTNRVCEIKQIKFSKNSMITNYVSKREISLKKRRCSCRFVDSPSTATKHHPSHRLGACQCREPPVSCSPIAL